MRFRRPIAAALLFLGLGFIRAAHAETYPDRVIKVIVPFVPGSPVDAA